MKNVPFFNLITEGTFWPIQYNSPYFKKMYLFLIGGYLLHNIVLVSAVPSLLNLPPASHHIPPHPTPLGRHRAPSLSPRVTQQTPTGSLCHAR